MILCTAVIKGGTGKTTTAAALAQAARMKKKKVLAVDLDAQANLSDYLAGDSVKAGSYDLLHGADVADVIQQTAQGIDLIPASTDLATEKTSGGSAKRLEAALAPVVDKYDLIIIDTPPTIGELTFNALQASTALLIPLYTDPSSLKGLVYIADVARQMRERSAKKLSYIAAMLTQYRAHANINQLFRDKIKEAAKQIGADYLGEIRDGVAIKEAQAMRRNLFEYAPKAKPTEDYMSLYQKLMRRK